MNTQDIITYGIIVIGSVFTLIGAYQVVRRGFILWLILIIVGISAINYGLSNRSYTSFEGLLREMNPSNLSEFSKKQLREVCSKIGTITEPQ